MKKRIIMSLCIIIVIGTLIGCGSSQPKSSSKKDSKQTECLQTLKKGLEERWDMPDGSSLDEDTKLYAECAQNELKNMKKYEDVTFEDEDFTSIIQEYIAALNSQVIGAEYFIKDSDQFEDLYNVKGYDVRSKCVKKLVDKYKFSVSKKYKDNLKDFISGKRMKWTSTGESKEVTVDYGKVKIQVDGFKRTGWEQYEEQLETGSFIGAIECTVENETYEDEYNPNYILSENIMVIMDDEFVTKTPYSTGYSPVDEYDIVAGGMIPNGAKTKVGIPCVFTENQTRAVVQLGEEYLVVVNLEN